jgi:uncharacterized protein YbjT (DUF2867 family)
MRIALLGATGATGRLVIGAALRDGHEIQALIRPARPGSAVRTLPLRDGLLQRTGDATQAESVAEIVKDCEAAICLVGPVREAAPDLCARTATALVEAARHSDLARIVLVTGAMIGHPSDHTHGLYRVVPALLGAAREDRLASERIVRDGMRALGRAHVIVRPPRLGDGPTGGWVLLGPEIEIGTMDGIPRVDLAEVLLEAALGRWDGSEFAVRSAHADERGEGAHVIPFGRSRSDTARLPRRPSGA